MLIFGSPYILSIKKMSIHIDSLYFLEVTGCSFDPYPCHHASSWARHIHHFQTSQWYCHSCRTGEVGSFVLDWCSHPTIQTKTPSIRIDNFGRDQTPPVSFFLHVSKKMFLIPSMIMPQNLWPNIWYEIIQVWKITSDLTVGSCFPYWDSPMG